MDGNSQTPQKERLEALRLLMPEVFDEGYIDWEKLKVALGENVNFTNERYVLNWAGTVSYTHLTLPTKLPV